MKSKHALTLVGLGVVLFAIIIAIVFFGVSLLSKIAESTSGESGGDKAPGYDWPSIGKELPEADAKFLSQIKIYPKKAVVPHAAPLVPRKDAIRGLHPRGILRKPPVVLAWTPPSDAKTFSIELLDDDGEPLESAEVRHGPWPVPRTIDWVAGRDYEVRITAVGFLGPYSGSATFSLATQAQNEEFERGIELLDKAPKAIAPALKAHFALGQGFLEDALVFFQKHVEIEPRDSLSGYWAKRLRDSGAK